MDKTTPDLAPGSPEEYQAFQRLQAQFSTHYAHAFNDIHAPRTVLVVPSLSLDQEVLNRISGVHHYEERMLCMLLLLRMPNTRVIYVTSQPIVDTIIDYYMHLLPAVPPQHARRRLCLLSCYDATSRPLTEKILHRPRLLARIRGAIEDTATAHMSCFTVSDLERTLAVRLGIPLYGCDPALLPIGSKSGSRRVFRETGVAMPDGTEDLSDAVSVADGLVDLKKRRPNLRRAVVKLNEGFSGEGNALFRFDDTVPTRDTVLSRLPNLEFEAAGMTWELFDSKLKEMGGIVEEFVEGDIKRSPSVQYRIDPLGEVHVISTHDQILGGHSDQIFMGCRFPADEDYRLSIQREGKKAADALKRNGVLGRFGVDFISVREPEGWRHYAIEINLRKGGTTHPFLMLQFLTDGHYDEETGLYRTPTGHPCFYHASDNLEADHYRGMTPDDLVDIAVDNELHFNSATQQGVVFHLIGALSEFGKLGVVCIGETHETAHRLYHETVQVLDREQA